MAAPRRRGEDQHQRRVLKNRQQEHRTGSSTGSRNRHRAEKVRSRGLALSFCLIDTKRRREGFGGDVVDSTSPWFALTVTVIGAPILALVMMFLIPIGAWLQDPPWWFRDGFIAVIVGAVVAYGSLQNQKSIDDDRADRDRTIESTRADRDRAIEETRAEREETLAAEQNRRSEQLENLRFVRDRASFEPQTRPFSGLDLEGQDVAGLQLDSADFTNAKLTRARLDTSYIRSGLFGGAQLAYASLDLTVLDQAFFVGADMSGASLRGCYLRGSTLSSAQLSGANLEGAHLEYANIGAAPGLVLVGISAGDAAPADLREANLSGAKMTGANLVGVDLTGIYYDPSTTVWPQGFRPPPSRPLP
jgi:uncharacterized protein YjbI with pentapeptide repeats